MRGAARRGGCAAAWLGALALLATAAVPGAAAPVDAVSPGPSLGERLAVIRERVQSRAAYPALARERGVQGRVVVSFAIDAAGAASDPRTHASSGSLTLDRAALEAVHAAAPFPWVYGRVEVPVEFVLAPQVAAGPVSH